MMTKTMMTMTTTTMMMMITRTYILLFINRRTNRTHHDFAKVITLKGKVKITCEYEWHNRILDHKTIGLDTKIIMLSSLVQTAPSIQP